MKRGRIFNWVFLTFLGVVLLVSFQHALTQESAEELYEAAVFKKESEGDLNGAIQILLRIVREFPADKKIAGKAQLQIGMCYEKLGKEEAIKAYELVLKNYADQPELVAAARSRIAALTAKKPSEPSLSHIYSWAGDDFYLENQSLSPDGTKLLGIDFTTGQNAVYKDLTTGKFENITHFDWENSWTYNPVWSPDGKRIAFKLGGWKDPIEELRIYDLSGESRTIYRCDTKDEIIYPVEWFPEERTILAIHVDKERAIRLGTVSVQGGVFSSLYEIGPHKGANFRPDAGNIIKADLSSDGRHVVFHELKQGVKNIYVLDVAEKTVKALMDSPANNMRPVWSPDGEYIAFMSDRSGTKAIWAIPMKNDGNAAGQPFFLRDGQYTNLVNWTALGLCYTNWMEMVDVFIMPVDPQTGAPAGKAQQLDFRPTGRNSYPLWSPDGKHLAFVSNLYGIPNELHVVIYPISGGEARKFRVPSPQVGGTNPPSMLDLRWLPDGSGISYSAISAKETAGSEEESTRKMFLLKLDSEEWQTWDLDLENKSSFTGWRGDGKGFYYTRNSWESESSAPGIVERDMTTGDERYIYRPENGPRVGFPSMRCSRDFSKLAFYQFRDRKICVIDIKSGKKLNEFKGARFPSPPAWSPDGNHLMIPMWRQDTKLHVYSIVDGSSQAFDLDMDFFPKSGIAVLDWAPDGTKIAFASTYTMFDTYLLRNVIPKK